MTQAIQDAVRKALFPTSIDMVEMRDYIMSALKVKNGMSTREFEEEIFEQKASMLTSPDASRVNILTLPSGQKTIDADKDPYLVRKRLGYAIHEALVLLLADGIIIQVAGDYRGTQEIYISTNDALEGRGSNVSIPDISVRTGIGIDSACWRLARPENQAAQSLLTMDLAWGLKDLLLPRGFDTLKEAIRSFNAGLYMGAVDLLGAASEAAWVNVGDHVDGDSSLARLIRNGDSIAQIIEKTAVALRSQRILPGPTVNKVRAEAERYRDLRNYGLHPRGEIQHQHEVGFTQSGAGYLFMNAYSYFLQLDQARVKLFLRRQEAQAE